MADDTPDTPDTPAPRRRAAPRKPAAPRKAKDVVSRAEGAVTRAATAAKDAVVGIEERAVRAVKPRSTSRSAARPAASRKAATKEVAAPRTTKKPGPKPGSKRTTRAATPAAKSTFDRATDAVGGRLAAAAIGAVAAGATVAAMLTLRGSSAKNLGTTKKPIDITGSGDKGKGHPTDVHGGAHQPDGTDSSASFAAGIADENTVPGKN